MFSPSVAALRRQGPMRAALAVVSVALLAACGTQVVSPSISASGGASATSTASPTVTPTPLPTPQPTPLYTNPPDPAMAGIIPDRINGLRVDVPDHSQFAYTPGDMVPAYGDLALRFSGLQVAFVLEPRLSLYVARVSGELPSTRDLEPYLATAGEYVGIAGLHRSPWHYRTIGGRVTWVRPEDNATALGTHIYTWTGGDYVFLLIGTDEHLNRAMFAALPGEKAPPQTPRPTPSSSGSSSPSEQPSSEATAGS